MKILISLSALAPSLYRKYVKGWDKGRYAEAFRAFAGKDTYRIYIPLNKLATEHTDAPKPIVDAVTSLGWQVEDYRAGIAVDKTGKRRIRIGKLLAKHPVLQKQFNEDKSRASYKGKHIICISRHPYDIAGASTDRGWVSCMHLVDGSNKSYVADEVRIGTIVAYLIEEHDKNIKNPTARVLIKPFYKEDDYSRSGKPLLIADKKAYGTPTAGFVESVQKWLDRNINKHSTEGLYELHEASYDDGTTKHLVLDFEDDAAVDRMLKLDVDDSGYIRNRNRNERRAAFKQRPELLKRFPIIKVDDLRAASMTDPEAAYEFLNQYPERVFEGSDSNVPIKRGDANYRYEARAILNQAPHLFNKINHDIGLRDDELKAFIQLHKHIALALMSPEHFTAGVIEGVAASMTRSFTRDMMKMLPESIMPADDTDKVGLYPQLLTILENPTLDQVKTAMAVAKPDTRLQIMFALDSQYMTVEIVEYLQEELIEKSDFDTLQRLTHTYTAEETTASPAKGNTRLIIKCLQAIEHIGYDLVKFFRVTDMLNLLPDNARSERLATGHYFNVLQAAFLTKTLRLTEGNCLASMEGDDCVDFIRGKLEVLEGVRGFDSAFSFGIDVFCTHQHRDYLLEQNTICHLADTGFWRAMASRHTEQAVREMRKLLTVSKTFGDLVAPHWFTAEEVLSLYKELRPDLIQNK